MKKQTAPSPSTVGEAIAQLLPNIIRGAQLETVAKSGVTHTQFIVLMALKSHRHCSMSVLAQNLHASLPTATGIVDRLVQAGLVRRRPSPSDRRQVLVELTDKGESTVQGHQAVVKDRWKEVLRVFNAAELKTFLALVNKLRIHLEARQ